MPNTLSLLLATLLLITAVQSHDDDDQADQRFKEAPKFSNSPHCPPIPTVHVAMTLDSTYLRGSMAAVLSVLQHSSCPENVRFHFISLLPDPSPLRFHLSGSFPYLKFQIYPFNPSLVSGHISTSIRSALDSPLNYARNYIADILPDSIRRVVYLDSDVILVDDIEKLASTELPDGVVLAAPEYCNADLRSYFTPTFWASAPLASAAFAARRACYFNTGVMVMDMARWRAERCTDKIVEWMELQKRIRIYELGSLPPFLLVFAGRIASVDHRWNQHGLGGDNFRGLCRNLHPGPVSLLHWSGKGKPWVRLDAGRPCPLDALWAPYDLLEKGDGRSELSL